LPADLAEIGKYIVGSRSKFPVESSERFGQHFFVTGRSRKKEITLILVFNGPFQKQIDGHFLVLSPIFRFCPSIFGHSPGRFST
jgi:hypothetical protein